MTAAKEKITSIEMMRILAIFAVICLHTRPFQNIPGLEPLSCFIRANCRFAVPFFFAISGYFYGKSLRRGISPLRLFGGYFTRLGTSYVLWVFIYLFITFLGIKTMGRLGFLKMSAEAFRGTLSILNDWWMNHRDLLFFQGSAGRLYHLWFLPALISGLAVVTLFRMIRQEKWLIPFSAVLFFVGVLSSSYARTPIGFHWNFNTRNGPFFSGLFVALGYWQAQQNKLPSLGLAVILIAGGFVSQLIELYFLRSRFHTLDFDYVFGTLLYGAGIFALVLAKPYWGKNALLLRCAEMTGFVYLSHMLFADKLFNFGAGRLDQLPHFFLFLRELILPVLVYVLSVSLGIFVDLFQKRFSDYFFVKKCKKEEDLTAVPGRR